MRVLIIDDSPSILECTRALLESHGHEVMTWPEEVDGCQEVKNWFLAGFDVVICDGLGGEGQKFLIGVRRDYPKIKTILFLGLGAVRGLAKVLDTLKSETPPR